MLCHYPTKIKLFGQVFFRGYHGVHATIRCLVIAFTTNAMQIGHLNAMLIAELRHLSVMVMEKVREAKYGAMPMSSTVWRCNNFSSFRIIKVQQFLKSLTKSTPLKAHPSAHPSTHPPPTSAGRDECRAGSLPPSLSSRCSSGARVAPEAEALTGTFQHRVVPLSDAAEHSEASETQTPEAAPAPSPSQGRVCASKRPPAGLLLLLVHLLHTLLHLLHYSSLRHSLHR